MRIIAKAGVLAAVVAASAGAASAQQAQIGPCLGGGTDYCSFVIEPGFLPDPLTSTGVSGGPTQTPDCGNIDGTPDHEITITQDFASLRMHVESQGDVTLLVEGPFGRVCSDDVVGLLPEIQRDFPAGTYQVWVGDWQGTWSMDGASPYTFHVTEYSR